MKRLILIFLLLSILSFSSMTPSVSAQMQPQVSSETSYLKGKIVDVKTQLSGETSTQEIMVEITEGNQKGETIPVTQTFRNDTAESSLLSENDSVVVSKTQTKNETIYAIYDRYRIPPLLFIVGAFFLLVLVMTGRKGLGAITGLVISIAVLVFYIVPQIIQGANPLLITISGSLVIMIVTIYLAHGFTQRTTVAIGGTFISLMITGFLATFMVDILNLTGRGSEDAALLSVSNTLINLKGLLLSGIIIGTLGVLDDVTTTQTATIYTLAEANEKYTVSTLIKKGLLIGREHITSLVNTLVLAYAGASLPLFIFFVLNPLNQPLWLILNNEMITEEIVRTLAGSIGLILAVPITTALAAFFARYNLRIA